MHLPFFFTNIFTNDNTVLSFTIHSCAISSSYYGKKKLIHMHHENWRLDEKRQRTKGTREKEKEGKRMAKVQSVKHK